MAAQKVTSIELDEKTRMRILKDLGIKGDIDRVPERIAVTRVASTDLEKLRLSALRLPSWVLVLE